LRGRDADGFGVQHDAAAPDAIAALDLIKAQDALAAKDQPLEHPVERAAVQHLIGALGPHPRDVARQTVGALGARVYCQRQVLDRSAPTQSLMR
jgi:hypothetical protein